MQITPLIAAQIYHMTYDLSVYLSLYTLQTLIQYISAKLRLVKSGITSMSDRQTIFYDSPYLPLRPRQIKVLFLVCIDVTISLHALFSEFTYILYCTG